MIQVEFKAARKGTCQWCRKERDEVFDVAFGDKSFVGMLCKADLFRAIGMKLPLEAPEAKPDGKALMPNGPWRRRSNRIRKERHGGRARSGPFLQFYDVARPDTRCPVAAELLLQRDLLGSGYAGLARR